MSAEKPPQGANSAPSGSLGAPAVESGAAPAIDPALADLQRKIRRAAREGKPLAIRGGGTKDFYGQKITGDVLDTTGYAGIVDYDATELVVTARAGTPLAELESTLSASGQMLACEPPSYGAGATLGGMVAAGLSGPRRPYAGAVRDFVLGVRMLDGSGEDLSFGGRVMKNVAGFDLARLMTGALGTLGVLTEVSLRCLPLPKLEATYALECSPDESIRMTNEWGGKPIPLSATCHHDGRLHARLSGAAPAVEAAAKKIGGSAVDDGDAFWLGLREQTHPYFAAARDAGATLWRLSVKPTTPFADLGAEQLIEWGGALRWLIGGARTDPIRLRAWAESNGGHATLFRAPDKAAGVFHPLSESLYALHRRLKATFDPSGILNRGRLYADF